MVETVKGNKIPVYTDLKISSCIFNDINVNTSEMWFNCGILHITPKVVDIFSERDPKNEAWLQKV